MVMNNREEEIPPPNTLECKLQLWKNMFLVKHITKEGQHPREDPCVYGMLLDDNDNISYHEIADGWIVK